MQRRVQLLAGAGVLAVGLLTAGTDSTAESPPTWHLFSGADLTSSSSFVHQGAIWSPRGVLHDPGWRFRGLASAGAYRYRGDGVRRTGRMLGLELTPGYSWLNGHRGLTLYLGGMFDHHRTKPHDPGKEGQGSRFGARVLAEGWVRVSESLTIDAAAGYATASRSYSARLAASVAVSERLVLEPEVAAFGEPGYDQQRVGLLAELHRTERLRILAGGGWARDSDGGSAYVSVQLKSWR